jgi:hypothetical protein
MVEARIDLMSPLRKIIQSLGEELKSALPDNLKTKLTIEADVEDSFSRLKGGVPTAVQQVQSGGAVAADGGTGDQLAGIFESIKRSATGIAYWQDRIDQKKGSMASALENIERLENKLERAASSGKKLADNMGGDEGKRVAEEIEQARQAGKQGKGGYAGGEEEGGSKIGSGQLLSMIRNPEAAMQQGLTALVDKLGGGGLGGMLGGVAGGAAAAAGGVYAGWKINDRLAGDAGSDAQKMLEDYRLSRASGSNIDFRGTFYNADRTGIAGDPDSTRNVRGTRGGRYLSLSETRKAMRGMGVGLDDFQGGLEGVADTAMDQSQFALKVGISTEQANSMVGAGIRGGTVNKDADQILKYLSLIAGSTDEAAKQGVTRNERLGQIASASQATTSALGFLSPEMMKSNLGMIAAMGEGSSLAFKHDQQGSLVEALAGAKGEGAAGIRQIGTMMGKDQKLLPQFQKLIESDPDMARAQKEGVPDYILAKMMLQDKNMSSKVNVTALKGLTGMNRMLVGSNLGIQSFNAMGFRANFGSEGFGDPNAALDRASVEQDKGTAAGMEANQASKLVYSAENREEVRKTGYELEAAKNLNEAATRLNTASDALGKALSDGSLMGPAAHAYMH